jgi:hypothetical protein
MSLAAASLEFIQQHHYAQDTEASAIVACAVRFETIVL